MPRENACGIPLNEITQVLLHITKVEPYQRLLHILLPSPLGLAAEVYENFTCARLSTTEIGNLLLDDRFHPPVCKVPKPFGYQAH
jgi:hypothetical protein